MSARTPDVPLPRRRSGREHLVGRGLIYLAAILLALFILVPIYLIAVSAFTPPDRAFEFPRRLVPAEVNFETIIFFRYAFRGRSSYRLVILSTRAFPIVILAIPLAVTYRLWGINDSVIGVALMHTALALPFTVLITSSVFVSVPRELEEAAQTLGCNPLQAFVKVSLPLALPGLAAAAIFTWVLSWNDVFAAVILTLQNPTLPARILTALTQSPIYFQFAAGFVMLVPSLVVIFFIRKYLLGLWGRVVK